MNNLIHKSMELKKKKLLYNSSIQVRMFLRLIKLNNYSIELSMQKSHLG